jgi:hypothetical protein
MAGLLLLSFLRVREELHRLKPRKCQDSTTASIKSGLAIIKVSHFISFLSGRSKKFGEEWPGLSK